MLDIQPPAHAVTVTVLALPGTSHGELGMVLDTFWMANTLTESTSYSVQLVSVDGQPVQGLNGRPVAVDAPFDPARHTDLLIVLAARVPSEIPGTHPAIAALLQFAHHRSLMLAMGAGSYWLAQAGLLNGYRATVHWTEQENFSERFPQTITTSNLFERDRDRLTCGGGSAVVDALLSVITEQHGNVLAAGISEYFLLERIRGKDDRQRIPLQNQIGAAQPKLVQAVMLMEANLEEPLTTDEIAQHVNVSRRQLERLFKQHLNSVPSQYYLELRLNKARTMLRQTSKSIIQIGLSCGFSSGPHFSSAYRNHFGITPRDERTLKKPAAV